MKEYVTFELAERKPKTSVYAVKSISTLETLGKIYWYGPWRQYVFEPLMETLWSRGCMSQIEDFIKELMDARKR